MIEIILAIRWSTRVSSSTHRLLDMSMLRIALLIPMIFSVSELLADQVTIVKVTSQSSDNNHYRFNVTLAHHDSGWDHYADGWDVLTPEGQVLATRVLYHPHVNEQPFTRSLSAVAIPAQFSWVNIRAHDKVHGYTKQLMRHNLTGRSN